MEYGYILQIVQQRFKLWYNDVIVVRKWQ